MSRAQPNGWWGAAVLIGFPPEESEHMADDRMLREMTSDPKFRKILVTDGKSEVGQAIVKALVKAGADIVWVGHAEPWKKIIVGGSDDHGGQFLATAFTETPKATSSEKFLEHVRNGKCEAKGQGGTPLALSHGFYNTLYCYIQDRVTQKFVLAQVL